MFMTDHANLGPCAGKSNSLRALAPVYICLLPSYFKIQERLYQKKDTRKIDESTITEKIIVIRVKYTPMRNINITLLYLFV